MLYHLKSTLINFLPAHIHQICLQTHNNVEGLHVRFLNAGGLSCLLNILSETKYTDQCDISTRKSIYFIVLYLLKRLLIILAIYQLRLTNSTSTNESLEQILTIMPTIPLPIMNVVGEQQHVTMSVEQKIATALIAHRTDYPISKSSLLQYDHIRELIRLIWCLASDSKENSLEINLKNDFPLIHRTFKQENIQQSNEISTLNDENEEDEESQLACREGLELLCISLSLVPLSVERFIKRRILRRFFH